ncbi:hypothetical protein CLIB1444_05S07536 [[Candida] jaroonii]|uniref:Uncharacterized protein n=1 Tax=[Candida] jaroonii TaxID=467808 RepID=A0ACA9Y8D5_9ASCO|nr:hypothetical protein CLIB1444_05S07536 [[Candida] jaroonii]
MLRANFIRCSRPIRLVHTTPVRYSVVDTAKDVLNKANKKTGEFLAGTMETVEQAAPTNASDAAQKAGEAAEKVSETASEVNKKSGEVLADGMQKVEDATPGLNDHPAKKKVDKNSAGYKDLQDKGAKAESEQNRPEDGL